MRKNKKSFFERLTGSVSVNENKNENLYGDVAENTRDQDIIEEEPENKIENKSESVLDKTEQKDGVLPVDMHQTPDEIVINSVIGGVRPENLDVSITRDMVTIRGKREKTQKINEDNYSYQELYWGSFSRNILLPQEIEVEEAEAIEKNGMLHIKLPKINKEKQTRLKVKSD